MKQIKNTAAPALVASVLTPVSATLSIIQVDGRPLTQAEDASKGIWIPDRTIDPLILQPQFDIVDQETKQKVTQNIQYHWYLDKVDTWDNTTKTGEIPVSYTSSDGYYYEKSGSTLTGRLVVTANIHYIKDSNNRGPVNVLCVATSSTAKYGVISETQNVQLTSSNIPDQTYRVVLNTPNTLYWHPFNRENPALPISATVYRGEDRLTQAELANITFFWYINGTLDNSKKQSSSITYDADALGEGKVELKIATSAGASNPNVKESALVNIAWSIPPMSVDACSMAGNSAKTTTGNKEFRALVKVRGLDVDEDLINEYLRFQWETRPVKTNINPSEIKDQGVGRSVVIPNDDLFKSTVDTEVRVTPYMLGVRETVTCSNETVTCNSQTVTCRK